MEKGKFINTSKLTNKQKVLKYYENIYPYNPNGSEDALAGVCSENGRHLAMMPHPERCFQKWQLPYLGGYSNIYNSPWLLMFKNIFE